ncbi:hypothetical protein [Microbulbifer sp. THAF38]|uniref:hypothetical protein n=1 Tax=Microbulbifer sp. THAF38 TaxID=2587856 RepID=UPI0012A944E1|nr:hypothetical protein [Microbulbifer sp. THAF38]QFT55556.1 hypothetical protein FIU95_13460 [Microbulbifer sp. THAF38]
MMKYLGLVTLTLVVVLTGCSPENSEDPSPDASVGSGKDKHGCIASAGYRWCAKTKTCERPWELAEKAGFPNTPDDFEEYCGK